MPNVGDAPREALGYEQLTSLGAPAKALTVPARAKIAFIQAEAQAVRWRDDGTDPTASVGMRLVADEEMWFTGDLNAVKFIEEAAGAKLNVSYYA